MNQLIFCSEEFEVAPVVLVVVLLLVVLLLGVLWHWREERELWELWHLHLWHLHLWHGHLWHGHLWGHESEVLVQLMVVLVVVRLEFGSELHVRFVQIMEELLNLLFDTLEELVYIWEHELKRIDVLVLVVDVEVLNLGVESSLLDVLSLDRLVPLVVEATEGGNDLTHVVGESVELGHLLNVGVAGVVGVHKLRDVPHLTHDLEHVVEDALLHVLHEDALSWVLDAPGLGIVLDSLEVAHLGVLVEHIDQLRSDILDVVDVDGPEVIIHLVVKVLDLVDWSLHPGTEALIWDNLIVLGVNSGDEALVGVLEEESVKLDLVQLWSISLWAFSSHLVVVVLEWACLDGAECSDKK